jgi:hypothetical protein
MMIQYKQHDGLVSSFSRRVAVGMSPRATYIHRLVHLLQRLHTFPILGENLLFQQFGENSRSSDIDTKAYVLTTLLCVNLYFTAHK